MGRRGPAPTPTRLKVLRGNAGRRPLPKDEPMPEVEEPTCPAHLDGMAKREWKRVVKELKKLGLLAKLDRPLLSAYCSTWSLFVQAERECRKGDLVVESSSGYPMQSPWIGIRNKQLEKLITLAGHFGMSPSARTTVKSVLPDGRKDQKISGLRGIVERSR